ncbi:class I SAM-dependent methyltransferase [Kribbella deserti]|uniref:Class I SAM-dependent methyltransferase n=1 Tax=Kribbella deserti TaxID=1926257 RepID=A0ABV6QKS5_9ACTN
MTDFLARTRESYDLMAASYAEQFDSELKGLAVDRALLAAFAELVPAGPVLEVGSGPGHTTAHLHELGLDVSGIDLSPRMVEIARTSHPQLRFEIGSMTAIDVPDASLAGLVSWYGLMHIPPAELPGVFAEFRRVVKPGGQIAIAVVAGDELVRRTEAFGQEVELDYHLREVDTLAAALNEAGLDAHTRVSRDPAGEQNYPRAYALVNRP